MLIKQKHFSVNYRFCQKYRNDAYSREWEGHVVCVTVTHGVRKSICNPPMTHFMPLVSFYTPENIRKSQVF